MVNAEDKRYEYNGQPDTAALSVDREGNKRPELLAPAGEPDALYGAFSAGADAVYLGALSFSARAFAKNFSVPELIRALDHAHVFGKKIYLACNILLRESELTEALKLIDQLYIHGLDGIIIQDLGLLSLAAKRYPSMPLHASTQMSVNSECGARWLKEHGVSRLVPGRELSVEEIRQIRKCGIELECFVHGAMCYSYSGRCLLSSMAGGRSGNRGRCAGPCRKAYSLNGRDKAYYLSMKDMMALQYLPELIDAGVDSFKIEGRMKAPEYAAGVSRIYRKYIDLYLSGAEYVIDNEDIEALEELYMRSDIQDGYLHKHNGRDMISLSSPAYSKVSDERKEKIRAGYIEKPLKKDITAEAVIKCGEKAVLRLKCENIIAEVSGDVVPEAKKRPLADDDIRKQLLKTGDTDFIINRLDIFNDGNSFLAVSALNALRRDAFDELYRKLDPGRKEPEPTEISDKRQTLKAGKTGLIAGFTGEADLRKIGERYALDAFVIGISEFIGNPEKYLADAGEKKLYIRMPQIIRQDKLDLIAGELKEAANYPLAGIYCGSIDGIGLCREYAPQLKVIAEGGLYVFNPEAEDMVLKETDLYTVSHEFSAADIHNAISKDRAELIVYGRVPLMYSANCLVKTSQGCDRNASWQLLKDEMGHVFPVRPEHELCTNILYNCVPTSLHREVKGLYHDTGLGALRFEFTNESLEEQCMILDAYFKLIRGEDTGFPLSDGQTSRGHYKRGAE